MLRGSGRRPSLRDGPRPSWKRRGRPIGRFAVRDAGFRGGGPCGAVTPQDRLSLARRMAGRARGGGLEPDRKASLVISKPPSPALPRKVTCQPLSLRNPRRAADCSAGRRPRKGTLKLFAKV
jgi:hypothetical protein